MGQEISCSLTQCPEDRHTIAQRLLWPKKSLNLSLNRVGVCSQSVSVAQSCPTLCNPIDCSLPGSSVHEILQARILEWVAISFSRGSSWPRDQTLISLFVGRFFTSWATRGAKQYPVTSMLASSSLLHFIYKNWCAEMRFHLGWIW